MLSRLEDMVRRWYRLSSGFSSDLDRSLGKFSSLHDSLMSLAAATARLRAQLDPYSRPRFRAGPIDAAGAEAAKPVSCPPSDELSALQLDPSRLNFKHSPAFKPESFISDPLLKAGYADPRFFWKPESSWPRTKLARVMCNRERLLQLFRKWDSVNSLYLLDASLSQRSYRCGLFAVYKNTEKDRQILNPIPENSRRITMNESTTSLSHGSLLVGIHLEDNEDLVFGADDLEDFYHCFIVSDEHASRNHVHGVFPASVFKGWRCYRESLGDRPVVGCFRTLAMGTSFAVELAQHTHANLLRRAGCWTPSEQVRYHFPLPRGPTFQLLCIDDYCVIQKVPRGFPLPRHLSLRKDLALLDKARAAYEKAHLRASEKKAVRDSQNSVLLGAQLDGKLGTVCAPRLRLLALSRLTLQVVQLGVCTRQILSSLIGCWIYALLYRRPLLALLGDVFHEGENLPEHEVFALSTGAVHELLLLVTFAPFMFSNLRAQPLDQVFATDASLQGAGVCAAEFSRSATLELCRFAEQKGFYTRVDTSTLGTHEALQGLPIHSMPETVPGSLSEGFLWDFCEVFRGHGDLSKAHAALGLEVHPGFEIKDGAHGDVLRSSTMLYIIGLICRRVVRCFHVAPVCTTFGTLRRPRSRSKVCPFGFNPDDAATAEGNAFALRAACILQLCDFYQLLCSAEQPGGSVMYRLRAFSQLLQQKYSSVTFPFCNFGTPFQKMSCWLFNNPSLAVLQGSCSCGHGGAHFQVRGTFDHRQRRLFCRLCRPSAQAVFGRVPTLGQPVAGFSSGYPLPLCQLVAQLNQRAIQDREAVPDEDLARPLSSPPRWIGELARALPWKKLLQYRFRKNNHINIDESLAYRSLLRHLAKTRPSSRFCVLLDSRVVIGCSAKGRSSSTQLNYYLSTGLPYLIGGDLYPYQLHVGTHENPADDVSRFVDLRDPQIGLPRWLVCLLKGDAIKFDLVREADRLQWPWSGWARLLMLASARQRQSMKCHA